MFIKGKHKMTTNNPEPFLESSITLGKKESSF